MARGGVDDASAVFERHIVSYDELPLLCGKDRLHIPVACKLGTAGMPFGTIRSLDRHAIPASDLTNALFRSVRHDLGTAIMLNRDVVKIGPEDHACVSRHCPWSRRPDHNVRLACPCRKARRHRLQYEANID